MRPVVPVLLILLIMTEALLPAELLAYETDQFLNRTQAVEDSLAVMDRQVNQAIADILARDFPPRSRRAMARAIYWRVGGIYWADKIERWAASSPEVDRYEQTRHHRIYRGMPIWATRVNFLFGIGRSFRINDVMVGSDKLGHFFSQGYKYFRRQLRGESRERILAKGRFAERWIFGQFTTGVYSNADLVANYEGWMFYRSLFEDDIVPGKPAILVFDASARRFRQQRPYTWADHINDYWDEALNPSYNVDSLDWRLRQRISELCPEYRAHPSYYKVQDDAVLWRRYQDLGLKDSRDNRVSAVCAAE